MQPFVGVNDSRGRRCAAVRHYRQCFLVAVVVVVIVAVAAPLLPIPVLVEGASSNYGSSSSGRSSTARNNHRQQHTIDVPRNAYEVLGVKQPPHFTGGAPQKQQQSLLQAEIKRQYRALCLAYHPDKKQHLPLAQRRDCERLFKEVQAAYADIGTPAARHAYRDQPSSNNSHNSNGYGASPPSFFQRGSSHRAADPTEALRQAFAKAFQSHRQQQQQQQYHPYRRQTFDGRPFGSASAASSPLQQQRPLPSMIYVQAVSVPLRDLYAGRKRYAFHLNDTVAARLAAAHRGGMIPGLAGRALLYLIPVWRVSRLISVGAFAYRFWRQLPGLSESAAPNTNRDRDYSAYGDEDEDDDNTEKDRAADSCTFTANLQPGYKENTKLIFNDERTGCRGVQVHFVLKEASHPLYRRIGNDLHVSHTITPHQAANGCRVEIPSLADPDHCLTVDIPRHAAAGDRVTLPGQGWPNRKQRGVRGDLIVTVVVARRRSKTNRASAR